MEDKQKKMGKSERAKELLTRRRTNEEIDLSVEIMKVLKQKRDESHLNSIPIDGLLELLKSTHPDNGIHKDVVEKSLAYLIGINWIGEIPIGFDGNRVQYFLTKGGARRYPYVLEAYNGK